MKSKSVKLYKLATSHHEWCRYRYRYRYRRYFSKHCCLVDDDIAPLPRQFLSLERADIAAAVAAAAHRANNYRTIIGQTGLVAATWNTDRSELGTACSRARRSHSLQPPRLTSPREGSAEDYKLSACHRNGEGTRLSTGKSSKSVGKAWISRGYGIKK